MTDMNRNSKAAAVPTVVHAAVVDAAAVVVVVVDGVQMTPSMRRLLKMVLLSERE